MLDSWVALNHLLHRQVYYCDAIFSPDPNISAHATFSPGSAEKCQEVI